MTTAGLLRGPVKKERPAAAERSVERRDASGAVLGTVDLEPTIFGIEPNLAVLHQVVTAQLAAKRAGHPVDARRAPRSAAAARSPSARRAPATRARARPARRTTWAAASPSGRSPARTRSGRRRRWSASRCAPRCRTARASRRSRSLDRFGLGDAEDEGRRRAARGARPRRHRCSSSCRANDGVAVRADAQPARRDRPSTRASSTPTTSSPTTGSSSPTRRCRPRRSATARPTTMPPRPRRAPTPHPTSTETRLMRESMSVLHRPVVSEKTYALMDNARLRLRGRHRRDQDRRAPRRRAGLRRQGRRRSTRCNRKGKSDAQPPHQPRRAAAPTPSGRSSRSPRATRSTCSRRED